MKHIISLFVMLALSAAVARAQQSGPDQIKVTQDRTNWNLRLLDAAEAVALAPVVGAFINDLSRLYFGSSRTCYAKADET